MTLDHESEIQASTLPLPVVVEPDPPPEQETKSLVAVDPSPPARSSEPEPDVQTEPDRRLAAAQKANAAKEAAARIRANAQQYRVTLEIDPPKAKRDASSNPKRRAPKAKAAERQRSPEPEAVAAPRESPPKEPAAPMDSEVKAAPEAPEPAGLLAGAKATTPRPEVQVEPVAETHAEAEVQLAPEIEVGDTAQDAPAEPNPKTDASPAASKAVAFKPMQTRGSEPPPFLKAYRFRSAMGARSAGRILIGEAQPIRPSRPRRATGEYPRAAPHAGSQVEPRPVAERASRFSRLSQEIAEQQAQFGSDPSIFGHGEPVGEIAPPSRWSRLTSWLFGSSRGTTD